MKRKHRVLPFVLACAVAYAAAFVPVVVGAGQAEAHAADPPNTGDTVADSRYAVESGSLPAGLSLEQDGIMFNFL